MKKVIPVLWTVVALSLFVSRAFGWADAGHMVVAAEAYRQLTPQQKAQVFEVLKSHPDFEKWKQAYHPNPDYDLPAYVFIRSSTWPDEIRRTGNPYDHPNWHFIDYPLKPPAFPFEPDDKTNDNVLYGIAQCEQALSNPSADPRLRAAQMSYLVHLIGDIHQPLHCASLFTDVYTNGDRGGNDFYVKPAQQGVRLHGIWDSLLGNAPNPRVDWRYATTLLAQFPRTALPELTNDTTPKSWSLESRQLAIDKGYLHGELKGATDAVAAPSLPEGYTKAAKAVAERQIALAGYRLADDIQKHLKLDKDVPLLPENPYKAETNQPKLIGTLEAANYYDETMTITGRVVQVSSRPSITFINLDKAGPKSPFTAVIFPDNLAAFTDLHHLTGHTVEVSGTITEYHNKPEIILESPAQLQITDSR